MFSNFSNKLNKAIVGCASCTRQTCGSSCAAIVTKNGLGRMNFLRYEKSNHKEKLLPGNKEFHLHLLLGRYQMALTHTQIMQCRCVFEGCAIVHPFDPVRNPMKNGSLLEPFTLKMVFLLF